MSNNIYTADYRSIWKSHYGEIPKDNEGRSYEIHHIDGDKSNNDISNLLCVSIEDHYNIHLDQGDYGACLIMSERMKLSPEDKSYLASQQQLKRIAEGTHHLLNNPSTGMSTVKNSEGETFRVPVDDPRVLSGELVGVRKGNNGENKGRTDLVSVRDSEGNTKKVAKEEFKNDPTLTHTMKGRVSVKDKDGNTFSVRKDDPRISSGELVGVMNGVVVKCPHCDKEGAPGAMSRWHFDKCKHKGER
jgi:hypothetical protein